MRKLVMLVCIFSLAFPVIASAGLLPEDLALLRYYESLEEEEEVFYEEEIVESEGDGSIDEDYVENCYFWTVPYNMTEIEYSEKFETAVNQIADEGGYDTIEFVGPYQIDCVSDEEFEAWYSQNEYVEDEEELLLVSEEETETAE